LRVAVERLSRTQNAGRWWEGLIDQASSRNVWN